MATSVCAMEDGNQMVAQAAGAKLEMSDIIIRKKGKEINLPTAVTNIGGATAAGLVKIIVRPGLREHRWRLISPQEIPLSPLPVRLPLHNI